MSKSRNILASIALSKGKKFNFLKFWEHEKKLLKKNKKILGWFLDRVGIRLKLVGEGKARANRIINVEDVVISWPSVGIWSDEGSARLIHVSKEGTVFLEESKHGRWPRSSLQPEYERGWFVSIFRGKIPEEQIRVCCLVDGEKSRVGRERMGKLYASDQRLVS